MVTFTGEAIDPGSTDRGRWPVDGALVRACCDGVREPAMSTVPAIRSAQEYEERLREIHDRFPHEPDPSDPDYAYFTALADAIERYEDEAG